MNCRDYEERLNEIARGALMDAAARAEAMSHEGDCPACAARLADERMLTAELRALASHDAVHEAPPHIETALLAAFRSAHSAPQAAPKTVAEASAETPVEAGAFMTSGVVVSLAERRSLSRRTVTRGFAVAATAIAAAAAFLMIVVPGNAPPPRDVQTSAATVQPTSETETAAMTGQPTIAGEMIEESSTKTRDESNAQSSAPGRPLSQLIRPASRVQQPRITLASHQRSDSTRARGERRASEDEGDEEFTTDFIPLNQLEQSAPIVAGQLVRVELPRSALSRFGLPVSAERASERIKADVLLGEDGLAQAIRFVR